MSVSGEISIKMIFQNDKYFISNEILKTRKFYEFILVDTESVQISHVSNPESNGIACSKYKVLKVLNEKDWDQIIFTHKDFLKNLILKPLIIMITKMLGTILFVSGQILIPGFLTGMKKCKEVFQIGFRNGGFLWELLQIFFFLKSINLLNTSKPTVRASSLLEIATRYSFVLNLESLGFYVGIFVPTNLNQAHSLSIWLGNSNIKWWAAFKISQAQTFESVKDWIEAQKPKAKKPSKSKSKVPIWSQPLPGPTSWTQTKNSFPSNSTYRAFLKKVQADAAESLSKLADSDSNSDEEDTADSSAFLQQNEDMCFGFPYTPLE